MKKIQVRCWKTTAQCADGSQQTVVFTVPDFGYALQLFTCANCGALFAVSPDEEFYTKREFKQEKQSLCCPECNQSLANVLPYPNNFRCETTGQLDRYERPTRDIPPDNESIVREFWNPLS